MSEQETFTVTGVDAWGKPMTETFSVAKAPPRTWKDSVRDVIARWVFNGGYPFVGVRLHNFGYRHGFHRWRMITRIVVPHE